jgi:hypothetical protein
MKILFHKTVRSRILSLITILFAIASCSSYSTSLNEMESLNIAEMEEVKKGKACSKNLFGAFTLPYFGDTAIKLSGDQSIIAALKDGNIQNVYAVDKLNKNYVFYSKRCTIVFGH